MNSSSEVVQEDFAMEIERGNAHAQENDGKSSLNSSATSDTWGNYDSFRDSFRAVGKEGSSCNPQQASIAIDEEEMLFEPGMSSPQIQITQGKSVSQSIHKSPKVNELDSPLVQLEQPTTSTDDTEETSCGKCRKDCTHLLYSHPCGCYAVCKKCAMKMATGGKCKFCKKFYTSFTVMRDKTEHSDDSSSESI